MLVPVAFSCLCALCHQRIDRRGIHCGVLAQPPTFIFAYSALLLSTVLLAPHLTVYDLVILAPAFLLLSDWLVTQIDGNTARFKILLYFAFVLPTSWPACALDALPAFRSGDGCSSMWDMDNRQEINFSCESIRLSLAPEQELQCLGKSLGPRRLRCVRLPL